MKKKTKKEKKKEKKRKRKEKKKIMAEIVATNVVASRPPNGDRLQRRPLVPICSLYVSHTDLASQQ